MWRTTRSPQCSPPGKRRWPESGSIARLPAYQRSAVDNPSGAVYDGGTQNIRTGGVNDGGRETAAPNFKEFMQQMYGAEIRELTPEEKHLHKLMEERAKKHLNGQRDT